jgi:hypothetical protein
MTGLDNSATEAGGHGIRLIRWLMGINLGLVAFQAVSAGFFLSGYQRAMPVHAMVGVALQVGALCQAAVAIVGWRQGRVPAWVAGVSLALFATVLFQVGLGYRKQYWLHVPIGVGMFGWLTRQVSRLDTTSVATEARS